VNEFIYALTFISSSENKTCDRVITELVEGDVYHWGALMRAAPRLAASRSCILLRRVLRVRHDRSVKE